MTDADRVTHAETAANAILHGVYTVEVCPCCGSGNLRRLPAVVAPFLARYAVGSPPFRCSLAECAGCSFRFFDSRLTNAEVSTLYSAYRGEEYFKERHRAEPWYSRKVNDGIGSDPKEIAARNSAMESFLRPHLKLEQVGTVLDYGGDRGQFIPPDIGLEKYVFELSDATPVAGVTGIASETALAGRRFDLTLLFGVLEHCSEPLEVILKVRALMREASAHIVIGVPYERYGLTNVRSGRLYSRYLDWLLRFEPMLKLVDFYSTFFRVRANFIPPLGILKCHEHLNFFNEQSITALLRRAALRLVNSSITQTSTYPARTRSLNVLATT